ncbi:MAG: hypothetical protein ABSG87_02935 [Verrucomicrobiota bacterium]|jgi:hypothetical protein
MKIHKSLFPLLSVFLATSSIYAQGNFQNLDFESATIVPVSGDPYGRVEFAPAFPGWTGYTGINEETLALYNNIFLDSSGIGIFDANSSSGLIQGNFTAMLEAGLGLGTGQSANTTLSQTGTIPSNTQSLLFDATSGVDANTFAVSLNGQTLSLIPLSSSSNYTLYGANISAWADQTATLAFTVFAQQPYDNNIHIVYLDDIQFSTSSVPEPSEFALTALGALLLAFRRWGK